MVYFNQLAYPHEPYPAPGYEHATIKSGGCGVCCAAMLVSNLTDSTVTPVEMARIAMETGARVAGGTDMNRLGAVLSQRYGLAFSTTNDEAALVLHLKKGGMAAANTGGNRKGYTGVFSDSGHFVVIAGMENGRAAVLDPGRYEGKYDKNGRRGKVETLGDVCYCALDTLAADTFTRSPGYYLFQRIEEMKIYKWFEEMPDWARPSAEKAYRKGIIKADGQSGAVSVYESNLQVIVWLDRAGLLS